MYRGEIPMVKKYILSLCIASLNCQPKTSHHEKPLCTEESCCNMEHKDTHQCYCSFKCGPREMGSVKGDDPRMAYGHDRDGKKVTAASKKYGKHCFCQKRDEEHYMKRNCHEQDERAAQRAK